MVNISHNRPRSKRLHCRSSALFSTNLTNPFMNRSACWRCRNEDSGGSNNPRFGTSLAEDVLDRKEDSAGFWIGKHQSTTHDR